MKKLLILGASGRTGNNLLKEALSRGYTIHALVREPDRISVKSGNLKLFKGNPMQLEDISEAMNGCDAVISALNINRKKETNPWSQIVSPLNLISATMSNVISGMHKNGISRVITISAHGVNDSFQDIKGIMRWMINRSNMGKTYIDHGIQEQLLMNSGLEWTSVRPTMLTNADSLKQLLISYNANPKPKNSISRKHLAKFTIDILSDESFYRKAPTVSEY